MTSNSILSLIADNHAVFDALKSFMRAQFEINHDDLKDLNNNEIGEIVRARIAGLHSVDEAFRQIAALRTVEKTPETLNPAR